MTKTPHDKNPIDKNPTDKTPSDKNPNYQIQTNWKPAFSFFNIFF